jgi:hypothetical protein
MKRPSIEEQEKAAAFSVISVAFMLVALSLFHWLFG